MNVSENLKYLLRICISFIIILIGFSIISICVGSTSKGGSIGENIGLALFVAGVIALIQEFLTKPITRNEYQSEIQSLRGEFITKIESVRNDLKDGIENVLKFIKGPAIHLESEERLRYPGYHKWLVNNKKQDVFIAGHSVLHRMENDFGQLPVSSLEKAIFLKLSQGCNIKLLFLDPTWPFVDLVANAQEETPGENTTQTIKNLKKNLATSVGIVKRISDELDKNQGPLPGSLDIRVCQEVTQYALHHVICRDTKSEEMFIGLYFSSELGCNSPLFIVDIQNIRDRFSAHFGKIFARAIPLLSLSSGDTKPIFEIEYYRKCQQELSKIIGEQEVRKRLP
jgi:hypothetical protein